jgi:hypothetical protein
MCNLLMISLLLLSWVIACCVISKRPLAADKATVKSRLDTCNLWLSAEHCPSDRPIRNETSPRNKLWTDICQAKYSARRCNSAYSKFVGPIASRSWQLASSGSKSYNIQAILWGELIYHTPPSFI